MKKSILFVCKYNKFRSRVAEAYFKKINKNKNIKVESAGLIKGRPTHEKTINSAKKYGIKIKGSPKTMSSRFLSKTDIIIIVANDVPREIFKYYGKYLQKIVVWKIKDLDTKKGLTRDIVIKQIIKKVDGLVRELK